MKNSNNVKELAHRFYYGRYYPILVAFLVFVGSVSGMEIYTSMLNNLFIIGALFLCKTAKPLILPVCTYAYQVSIKNAPGYPVFSDFYYTGWRLPLIITEAVALIVAFCAFAIRLRSASVRLTNGERRMIISLVPLAFSFLVGGCASDGLTAGSLLFAVANLGAIALPLMFFCYGLAGEDPGALVRYFSFVSVIMAVLICAQLLHLYVTSDNIIENGSVIKTSVALGWGIWNLVGFSLAVLIPMIMYGAEVGHTPIPYIVVAVLTLVFSALAMSRNALFLSLSFFFFSLIVLCMYGKRKAFFRKTAVFVFLSLLFATVTSFSSIYRLLLDYFDRGFSDNGRFKLWRAAWQNFTSSPLFGKGFYGLDVETAVFGFLPKQAHNTVMQLLSATGICGFFSYAWYRCQSLVPFIKSRNLSGIFLFLPVSMLLLGSMLDNFIFNIYPLFYYNVAIAIVSKGHSKSTITVNKEK